MDLCYLSSSRLVNGVSEEIFKEGVYMTPGLRVKEKGEESGSEM